MSHSRNFGPLANQMRDALERYSREELIDLMTHILRIYVLEESVPMSPELRKPQATESLAGLSFPQLLLRLQTTLDVEELGRFRVDGATVYVTVGDAEFNLFGLTPILPPEPTPEESAPIPEEEEDRFGPREERSIESKPWRTSNDWANPKPERLSPKEPPSPEKARVDSLFGGTSNDDYTPIPLNLEAPEPPPPIAEHAPGDPLDDDTPDIPSNELEIEEPKKERREAKEEPPPLAEGDKQITPSNRFASLDLD